MFEDVTSKFVSFEGGDGMGKSTQVTMLAQRLRRDGHEVVSTREPGGTDLGLALREAIQQERAGQHSHVDARAELLMFLADRAQHVATVVLPALRRGAWVLTDRFDDSTIAYQSAGRGLDADEVLTMSLWASQGLRPGHVIVLDGDAGLSRARKHGQTVDRIEAAGEQFHDRVRAEFRRLAAADPNRYTVIDASRDVDQVHADVVSALALPDRHHIDSTAAR